MYIYKSLLLHLLLFLPSIIFSQQMDKPKLIIGITVDQMRAEYLYRFQNNYTETGFKRLLKEGFNAKNTHYNYIPTATGPGHASIFSGVTPTNHGIVYNDWYNRKLKRTVYCAEDTTVFLVKNTKIKVNQINKYSRSPKNLLATNFADQLKLFTNRRSKVIGISLKDRGAIFPVGHLANYAFWYHTESGNFITSTYYNKQLPKWLDKFNNKKYADSLLNGVWDTYLPIEKYVNSAVDNTPFERLFIGKSEPVFPYDLKEMRKSNGNYAFISEVPMGNSLLTKMAIATIKGEKLGIGKETDMLTISYSSTDYVGHNFGIRSKEVEDAYVRLDLELSELLTFLDDTIGKNSYLLFLTADHGASDNPVFLENNNLSGKFYYPEEIAKCLNDFLTQQFGNKNYIVHADKVQIYINDVYRNNQDVLRAASLFLKTRVAGIKDIYIPNLNIDGARNEHIKIIFSNSYNPVNSGDILLHFLPGWMEPREHGTTHGTAYNNDTHVPLLWYGWKIPEGEQTTKPVTITQIVPTLAMLLNIPLPDAANKEPILEIVE